MTLRLKLARFGLVAGLTALTAGTPALAFDMEAMTDAERDAFRAEVRAYLLDNPEVLMEAIGVLETRQQEAQVANDAAMVDGLQKAIFEDGFSWVGGNPEGDVTVVEFMDYRCGYCKKAFPEVEELINADGNIRFIVKEFPILGEESVLASRFAIAVLQVSGDEAYKDIHDTMMTMRANVSAPALRLIAEQRGLDVDAIFAAMESAEVEAVISANYALAQQLGITGTPGFIIGEQMVRGYVPLEGLMQVVAEERG